MSSLWIALGIVGVIVYVLYAGTIKRRNKALEALSGIDVQLKKRSNLIPNILTIAQKFMDHEKSLLTEITALRSQVDQDYDQAQGDAVREHLAAAEKLSGSMGKLMVQGENYPDLKSDETMVQAQRTYSEVEAQIAAARRFYNTAVRELNNAVQIFPSSVIARMFNIGEMPYYEWAAVTPARR